MTDIDDSTPPRRRTLTAMLWGTAALIAAPVLYVAGRFLTPPPPGTSSVPIGKESDLGKTDVRIVKVGRTDAVVMRDAAGELYAMSLRCTHAGCGVRWRQEDEVFVCPCHGGRFDRDGQVLKGPPKRPLERLEIAHEGGMVIVTDIPIRG